MAVKVLIPTPLRQFTGKQPSIECNAATVGEALGSLTGSFSELRKHLFTDEGKIRSFVNVYLNDEDIRFLDKENTRTKDGDTISIVPSIAGGSEACGKVNLAVIPSEARNDSVLSCKNLEENVRGNSD
jgi:molybdopterin converting factor small subunit